MEADSQGYLQSVQEKSSTLTWQSRCSATMASTRLSKQDPHLAVVLRGPHGQVRHPVMQFGVALLAIAQLNFLFDPNAQDKRRNKWKPSSTSMEVEAATVCIAIALSVKELVQIDL